MTTNLSKANKRKGSAQFDPTYWSDERVLDLTELLRPHGICVSAFSEWLGPLLGEYRGYAEVRDAVEPPPSVSAESLAHLIDALQTTAAVLRPNRLPAIVEAKLATEALRGNINLQELWDRLRSDSRELAIVATRVHVALLAQPSKAGAKPKTARNALLASIVKRLREANCTAKVARDVAEQVLILSGVSVPQGERAIRRAESGGRKLPKS